MEPSSSHSPPRFCRWTYTVAADQTSVVVPDGCVDVVVAASQDAARGTARVTDWDASPRRVHLKAGTVLTGYRLQPGCRVQLPDVALDVSDLSQLEATIADCLVHDPEIAEMIDALSQPGSRVADLARQQGVSERTLQRHFKRQSLPAPGFWRQLGRARRVVNALPSRVPLSEIALHFGYSDQAHMTRDCVRWFGHTPTHIRQDPSLMEIIAQPGIGNWSAGAGREPAGLAL